MDVFWDIVVDMVFVKVFFGKSFGFGIFFVKEIIFG